MLQVRNLVKSYGALKVTDNVSLSLEKGERRVILGPNGAGKTTLFNILAGDIRPDSGCIELEGRDITAESMEARARLGLARSYQKNNLFENLTIGENLVLAVATAAGLTASLWRDMLDLPQVRDGVAEVAKRVALTDYLEVSVASAPYGVRRQLEVGLALAAKPKLLLMDEPTSGVGPDMIRAFHRLIHDLPKELTVLIIEHDMDLALDVADRVTVLDYGSVVFEGTPREVRASELVHDIYLKGCVTDA